ncbi:MAG: hypothetical protein IKR86_02780 [Candidatus Methanomethylophilaceae archaeon]|nr:hypothetical protein [Candidatus Methanomethylophilaceae archaeon]
MKDANEKIGDKLDSVISGEKKNADDAIDKAVDEGKEQISEAIKSLNLDSLDLDGLQNLMKGKETELDSVATDIGKKVLEKSDAGKSFDLSSISDLLNKAKEIKEIIAAISSKIGALKG